MNPEPAKQCPRCGDISGDDWSQCGTGPCPMRGDAWSPEKLSRAARALAGAGIAAGAGPVPYERVLALAERLLGPGWQAMGSAPQDGREVLVRTKPNEAWRKGRAHVARYIPALEAWALFPGCAVGTDQLQAWRPMPPELET